MSLTSLDEYQAMELLGGMPFQPSEKEVKRHTISKLETSFGEARIHRDVEERDFQTFLNIVSLLMTKDVREGLKSFFDIREHTESKFPADNIAFCKTLKDKGIINPLNTKLLATALEKYGQESVVVIVNTVFELFKLGDLESSNVKTMKDNEKRSFWIFLDILALVMTKRVKEGMAIFFDIPDLKYGTRSDDDNHAFCYLLMEKGIISSLHIDILTTTLNECGQKKVAKFVDLLFMLYRFDDLDAMATMGDKKGDFQRFLDIFNLLMTDEVRAGLTSFFDIPEVRSSGDHRGIFGLCHVLQEKRIINPLHLDLFNVALEGCGQHSVLKLTDTLFELFKFGKLGAPNVPDGGN